MSHHRRKKRSIGAQDHRNHSDGACQLPNPQQLKEKRVHGEVTLRADVVANFIELAGTTKNHEEVAWGEGLLL